MNETDFAALLAFAFVHGLALFPIPAGCKAPTGIVASHATSWSNDSAQWMRWRAENPGCNFGVECGPSGLIVIDIDVLDGVLQREAFAAWWRANVGDEPRQPTVRTPSGGLHIYFRLPASENRAWGQPKLCPGVDVRAGNGYVVAPFSVTNRASDPRVKADGQYVLLRNDIDTAPGALVEHCTRVNKPNRIVSRKLDLAYDGYPVGRGERDFVQNRVNNAIDMLRSAPDGSRNNTLFRASAMIGVHIADGAIDPSIAQELLTEAAVEIGLEESEIEPTILSGFERGAEDGAALGANPAIAFKDVRLVQFAPAASLERPSRGMLKSIGEFCAEYQPLSYAIEEIVRTSSIYALTAVTGSGKTSFLVIAALAIGTARSDLLGREVKPGRVAYCAFENPDDVRMRFMIAAWRFGIDLDALGDKIQIVDARQKPEAILIALDAASASGEFVLIVVDTLQAAFYGDNLNDNVQTGELVRQYRLLTTQLKGHPAVVIAAHPVKNAASENLTPYGGGAILNELDGNLTLTRGAGGNISLHWQGKLRGPDFEPMIYRIDLIVSPQILDAKGRCVHLPVMRPLTDSELLHRAAAEVDTRMKLLKAIADEPKGTQRLWAEQIGRRASIVNRQLKKLQNDGLGDKSGGRWVLTAKGRRAIEEADV
jgi:hypothetical protein